LIIFDGLSKSFVGFFNDKLGILVINRLFKIQQT